jgi:hypothetical protein
MGAGRVLRLTAFVAMTFAAGFGARMALAEVLPAPTIATPTVSVTAPPLPTVTTPPLPTVTTPPLPTISTTTSGGTSSTPSHSGGPCPGSPPGGAGQSGGPTASASNSAASPVPSQQQSATRLHGSSARRGANDQATLEGDIASASSDTQHKGSAKQANGGVADTSHEEASGFTPAAVAGRVSNPFVIAALAAAVLLLGTAAVPRGLVPSTRLTVALMEHRGVIAAAGAAAFGAAIVALVTS